MAYVGDQMAWQQRIKEEYKKKIKFDSDFANNNIPAITNSRYDQISLTSQYTQGFSSLLTLEQKRKVLKDLKDEVKMKTPGPGPTFDWQGVSHGPSRSKSSMMNKTVDIVQDNPYMLKAYAKKEFNNKLAARSNYSFGGLTPFQRKASASGGATFSFDRQGVVHVKSTSGFAGANTLLARRTFGKFGESEQPISDMYQKVSQPDLNVPEHQYRGKYCGNKLRLNFNEPGILSYSPEKVAGVSIRPVTGTVMRTGKRLFTKPKALRHIQAISQNKALQQQQLKQASEENKQIMNKTKSSQFLSTNNLAPYEEYGKKFYPQDYFRRTGYSMK